MQYTGRQKKKKIKEREKGTLNNERRAIHQEDRTILNIYVCNNIA